MLWVKVGVSLAVSVIPEGNFNLHLVERHFECRHQESLRQNTHISASKSRQVPDLIGSNLIYDLEFNSHLFRIGRSGERYYGSRSPTNGETKRDREKVDGSRDPGFDHHHLRR